MKEVYTLEDHLKYNSEDTKRIVLKVFPHIQKFYDLEDVKQHMYERFHKNRTVQRWDCDKPAKYSTYMYRCISNFILSYYPKKPSYANRLISDSISLETPVAVDSSMTIGDTIADKEVKQDMLLDLPHIRTSLAKASNKRQKRKVALDELFEFYLKGYTDTEISRAKNITVAGVGCAKRDLRKVMVNIGVTSLCY